MNSPIQLPGQDQDPMMVAQMAQQQEAIARMRANECMMQGSAAVFGAFVVRAVADNDGEDLEPEKIKRLAHKAKEYGPYLAEAFGMVTLKVRDEGGQ